MTIQTMIRKWVVTAALVTTCALLAPAAVAGGHGYGHGQRGYANHGSYRTTVMHRARYVSAPRYTHYSRRAPARYYTQPAYGYADYGYARRGYGHYRPRHHWGVGEVLGAVVVGAVITNLISDVVQPRTTVVERTVYQNDPYNTRYRGSDDDGYYGDNRR